MELALVSVEAKPGREGGAAAAPTPEGRRDFPISFPRLLMFGQLKAWYHVLRRFSVAETLALDDRPLSSRGSGDGDCTWR